jgi:hypothetical protein
MTRITTRQLVELIQGKDLSTSEIYELVQNKYPGNSLTSNVLITRLKSMAASPNVETAQPRDLWNWRKSIIGRTLSRSDRTRHFGILIP